MAWLHAVQNAGRGMRAMHFKRAGFLTKIVVLALLIYLAITLIGVRGEIDQVRQQKDDLSRQVAVTEMENEELSEAIEHSDDPDMLEQVARDKGLVKEGEELYIDVAN